jgi:hypothetical protein
MLQISSALEDTVLVGSLKSSSSLHKHAHCCDVHCRTSLGGYGTMLHSNYTSCAKLLDQTSQGALLEMSMVVKLGSYRIGH